MEEHSEKPLREPIASLSRMTPREQVEIKPLELRAGDLCPVCRSEHLDYDGLLNLSCPKCGPAAVGCFT